MPQVDRVWEIVVKESKVRILTMWFLDVRILLLSLRLLQRLRFRSLTYTCSTDDSTELILSYVRT